MKRKVKIGLRVNIWEDHPTKVLTDFISELIKRLNARKVYYLHLRRDSCLDSKSYRLRYSYSLNSGFDAYVNSPFFIIKMILWKEEEELN